MDGWMDGWMDRQTEWVDETHYSNQRLATIRNRCHGVEYPHIS
jgi:hypothetical protein